MIDYWRERISSYRMIELSGDGFSPSSGPRRFLDQVRLKWDIAQDVSLRSQIMQGTAGLYLPEYVMRQ